MKPLPTILIALTSFAGAANQEVTLLRRTLKVDAVDTYTIVDKVSQVVKSPLGEMPVTIESTRTFVLRTKAVDEKTGVAAIDATTTFDELKADGAAAGMVAEKPKPFTQVGKVDVRGRMTFDRVAQTGGLSSLLSGSGSTLAAGSFVDLPEKAVKIGDTWNIVVPKSPMGYGADQNLGVTLTGEKEFDGVKVWVVSVKGILKTALDTSKIPGAKPVDSPLGPTTIRVKGEDDISGEGFVDKATGRTVSMITITNSKKTIEIVEAGITMETSGSLNSTITLKKPNS